MATQINKEVFSQLRQELGRERGNPVSRQAVYQRIARLREDDGTLSKEQAAYVLAYDNGINLADYLSAEECADIRDIVSKRASPPARASQKPADRNRKGHGNSGGVTIHLPKLKVHDPFLPKRLAEECKRMTEFYPYIYLFENSLRVFVQKVMEGKFGSDWWSSDHVPVAVNRKVNRRRESHAANVWHSSSNAHEIYYTDIKDLKKIMQTNRGLFQPFFKKLPDKLEWLTTKMGHIELHRNILAHSNPLDRGNCTELKHYFEQWQRQLKKIAAEIDAGGS